NSATTGATSLLAAIIIYAILCRHNDHSKRHRFSPSPFSQKTTISIQMKVFLLLSLALATASFGFDIPKGTFHLGQLEDAAKKAGQAKQPIAFIIAEKKMAAT
ncbi:hypothetical protein N9821_01685, partial [Akkermansiaceae bacterium]|nr:hypothetical protein [Akkermansiaceae bacterium]